MSKFKKFLEAIKGIKPYFTYARSVIKNNPKQSVLYFSLSIFLVLRMIYILRPGAIWWDASIYIGMGKWLFSGQEFGYFEPFRPLIWPFVQGIIWQIGLDNLFWGKILEVIFSMASIYMVYLIGEKIRSYAGLIAALLLGFTPFFFGFTNVELTDIPSVFFILLSIYLLMKDRPMLSGFVWSIAFLLRFPNVLFGVAVLLFIILEFAVERNIKYSFKKAFYFGLGFAFLGIPFFISNYILYKDILFPLKAGVVLVATDAILQSQYFYYVKNLLSQNPLLIFAPLALIPFLRKPWRENFMSHKYISAIFLIFAIYIAYFSQTAHKEVRYAIGFLPFAALLASLGLLYLRFNRKTLISIVGVACLILGIVNISQIMWLRPLEPERKDFYEYFTDKTGSTIITSTPMIMSVANVKLLGVFDAWDNALNSYSTNRENISYAALDTCGLACNGKNCESRDTLIEKLKAESSLELERKVGNCELMIYRIKNN